MAGLYLHTPFCAQKCHYCDFFSAPPVGNQLASWHLLLQRNLQLVAIEQSPPLESIFFGGGTPSLLSPEQINSILDCCRSQFTLSPEVEISLEANPCSLTEESLAGYFAAGVNRLSIGIQSFDDKALQLIGRRHTAAEALNAFRLARKVGFSNISIDLIFALPGQSRADLNREILLLLDLAPEHIGIYGLTIEPDTQLNRLLVADQIEELDEDAYADRYLQLSDRLCAAGYEHYEISNFARPGSRCRHNQIYWQRQTCLAAGAGAHGFSDSGYGCRSAIAMDLALYRQRLDSGQNPAERLEDFDQQQAMAESIYLALRTSDGIDREAFAQQFGQHPETAFPEAFRALESHLKLKNDRYSFQPNSWLIYDHLISNFL